MASEDDMVSRSRSPGRSLGDTTALNEFDSPHFPKSERRLDRARRFRKEPWFDESRTSVNFMRKNQSGRWPWGYVIYRTVYTPESDELWAPALAKIDALIDQELEDEREGYQKRKNLDELPDDYPEMLVREGNRNIIMDDKERYDGASVDDIRENFRQWVSEGVSFPPFCLVIDEGSLRSITAHPPPPNLDLDFTRGYVLVVDHLYTPDGSYDDETYPGWMRAEVDVLFFLYNSSWCELGMEAQCPHADPGLIPVFDGLRGHSVQGTS